MGDVHAGLWLGRRLWRPVAAELLVERRPAPMTPPAPLTRRRAIVFAVLRRTGRGRRLDGCAVARLHRELESLRETQHPLGL